MTGDTMASAEPGDAGPDHRSVVGGETVDESSCEPGGGHAGQRLLLDVGIDPSLARFAATHASWRTAGAEIEHLLVSLADKIWKAKRVPDLEQLVVDRRPARLDSYRQRLHAWAERYRRDGWPATTPEYLLRGYFRLLQDTGDLPRMIAFGTDRRRHDWMLALTTGYGAALAEIASTQEAIVATGQPDLAVMCELAICWDRLAERGNDVPPRLPAVWVLLGDPARADALAMSITDPVRRAWALGEMALAAASVGVDEQTIRLAERAEAAAYVIGAQNWQSLMLLGVAEAFAQAGQHERAIDMAHAVADPAYKPGALARVADALAAAGAGDRAESVARDAENAARLAGDQARVSVARTLAGAGWHGTAEALASSIADPADQATAFAGLAGFLAAAGEREGAADLATQAQSLCDSIQDSKGRAGVLADVAEALAHAGLYDRAEGLADTVGDPGGQAAAFGRVACVLAAAGEPERAAQMTARVESLVKRDDGRVVAENASAGVARALSKLGRHDQAEAVASAAGPTAIVDLAEAMAHDGELEYAARLAALAETTTLPKTRVSTGGRRLLRHMHTLDTAAALARAGRHEYALAVGFAIADRKRRAIVLSEVAKGLAAAGNHQQAAEIALQIEYLGPQISALCHVAAGMAAVGDHHQAAQVAWVARAVARAIPDPAQRTNALRDLARVTEMADYHRSRRAVVDGEPPPVWVMAAEAETIAAAGNEERAAQRIAEAEALAEAVMDEWRRSADQSRLTEALATIGRHHEALRLAVAITHPHWRVEALKIAARKRPEIDRRTGIAHLIRVAGWRAAADLLAEVDPAVLVRASQLHDELDDEG